MSKSITQINNELRLYQCCVADLAINYITKELNGHQNLECLLNKLSLAVHLIENLKCPENILELECLTQSELEENLEKINDLCGCINCTDLDDLFDDTISSTLSGLIVDNNSGFIRYN